MSQDEIVRHKNLQFKLKGLYLSIGEQFTKENKMSLFRKQIHCTTCGFEGKEKKHVRGSNLISVTLWVLAFATVGILSPAAFWYSVWRGNSVYMGCSACGEARVIPLKKWNQMNKDVTAA